MGIMCPHKGKLGSSVRSKTAQIDIIIRKVKRVACIFSSFLQPQLIDEHAGSTLLEGNIKEMDLKLLTTRLFASSTLNQKISRGPSGVVDGICVKACSVSLHLASWS